MNKHSVHTAQEWGSARLSIDRCSLGFFRLVSVCLCSSFPSLCSVSLISIPVISFELICLTLQIANLFDKYPIDSSQNNGGSSSCRSHTLLNSNMHACALMLVLNDGAECNIIMCCPSVTFTFRLYWLHSLCAGSLSLFFQLYCLLSIRTCLN